MGTDSAEVVEILPHPSAIKHVEEIANFGNLEIYEIISSKEVHRLMCNELTKLVARVINMVPEIEAARPRCSSGIQALCLLSNGIEKANSLLQHCSESSKLYLALTGNVIQSRCKKARNLLDQGLSEIQNMVPVMLASEISRLIADLREAAFSLDPSEEEAGKTVRALLQQYTSSTDLIEDSVPMAIRSAVLRLQITSQKTLLIEKRSIRNLLDKVGTGDQNKKQILLFLLSLLKKYGKFILQEQTENSLVQHEYSFSLGTSYGQSVAVNGHDEDVTCNLSGSLPPEEFKCPISLRLMHDPVLIASGQTFERMWIQKWLDEGHDTCPKTKMKLDNLSVTPDNTIKDLISKWCVAHGVSIPDPCLKLATYGSWETTSSSIASLGSSMNDLYLPMDFSNVSLGSLDDSISAVSSCTQNISGSNWMSMQSQDVYHCHRSCANSCNIDIEFLSKLEALPWESQCKAVEDARDRLKHIDQACHLISCENFVEPLIRFLKAAENSQDLKAQRTGCLLLLELVTKCRSSLDCLTEDVYGLLASYLHSEVICETLAILEILSCHRNCTSKIVASGALESIFGLLDTQIREFQELVVKIFYNLSLNADLCSFIASLDIIPKLVPYMEDTALTGCCVVILKNLCKVEDARVSIAKTDRCIASIAKLLDADNHEDQEHAVAILLSLCSQREQYCQLVMHEGVIPSLMSISVNGNEKGKMTAMELLRLLRDIKYDDVQSDVVSSTDSIIYSKEKKSKASRFFGKIAIFSK